jgi:hypothetical protein
MSGWGDFPHWEQLVGGVLGAYNSSGYDLDKFSSVASKLWDLPDHLYAGTLPDPGSGLVVAGPCFYSSANHDAGGGYLLAGFRCLIACNYRLLLVLLVLLGCISAFNLLLIVAAAGLVVWFGAILVNFASDHPGHAAALAFIIAFQWWREQYGDRREQRVEQRECEQQQHGQERDCEHHHPHCQLEERQQRKKRQPRGKQRQ